MTNPKENSLAGISNLLNSLKEVESYIITDIEGRIHMASLENYHELQYLLMGHRFPVWQ